MKAEEILHDETFLTELKAAIESGVEVDYGYDGEDEFRYDTFNSEEALRYVMDLLHKKFIPDTSKCDHDPGINTILWTKDSSKTGNAIIISETTDKWEVMTDYGNKFEILKSELSNLFHIAYYYYTLDNWYASCDEIQQMEQETHKHRILNQIK